MNTARWRSIRQRLFAREEGLCFYCRLPMNPERFTVDHVVPKSRGGSRGDLDNLVAACTLCNTFKRAAIFAIAPPPYSIRIARPGWRVRRASRDQHVGALSRAFFGCWRDRFPVLRVEQSEAA